MTSKLFIWESTTKKRTCKDAHQPIALFCHQKSSEINHLKQEINSGHCFKCNTASDLANFRKEYIDDIRSFLRCKEDSIDKLTAEVKIFTRNDFRDTHDVFLPQLEEGSVFIDEKDLLIDKQQTVTD